MLLSLIVGDVFAYLAVQILQLLPNKKTQTNCGKNLPTQIKETRINRKTQHNIIHRQQKYWTQTSQKQFDVKMTNMHTSPARWASDVGAFRGSCVAFVWLFVLDVELSELKTWPSPALRNFTANLAFWNNLLIAHNNCIICMNLEGKNYTLKCESQKKATKCLVMKGGSRWGQGVSHYSMSGHV